MNDKITNKQQEQSVKTQKRLFKYIDLGLTLSEI